MIDGKQCVKEFYGTFEKHEPRYSKSRIMIDLGFLNLSGESFDVVAFQARSKTSSTKLLFSWVARTWALRSGEGQRNRTADGCFGSL